MKVDVFCESGEQYGLGHYKRSENLIAIFKSIFSPIPLQVTFHIFPCLIIERDYDIVVIDSYIMPKEDYEFLDKHSKVLLCLDDFNRLQYPQKALILSPTFPKRRKFSGKDYIILNPSFFSAKTQAFKQNQVLITLGGSNQNALIENILASLPPHCTPYMISPHFSHPNAYSTLSSQEICSLIDESEIIITAGGGSLNEALSRGKKVIALSLAKNQKPQLNAYKKYFDKARATKSVQSKNKFSPKSFLHTSAYFSNSHREQRLPIIFNPFKDLSSKLNSSFSLVSHPPLTFGSKLPSLAHLLFYKALNLPSNIVPFHLLTKFQKKKVLKLRNQKEVREASFDSSPIALKIHLDFIQRLKQEWGMRISPKQTRKTLKNQKPDSQFFKKEEKHLHFAFLKNRDLIGVGTLAILSPTKAKIGLYKKMNHQRVGGKILKSLLEISQKIGIQELELEVLKSNTRAIAFYQKHHFNQIGEHEQHLVMQYDLRKE